jgi:hypothetical protein
VKYGAVLTLFGIFSMFGLAALIIFGVIPLSWVFHPITIGVFVTFTFATICIIAIMLLISDHGPEFLRQASEDQLSQYEAKKLLKHYLLYEDNIAIDRELETRIEYKNTASGSSEDEAGDQSVRVFVMTYERKLLDEYGAVIVNLEQPIEVDVESFESKRQAVKQLEDASVIRAKTKEDLKAHVAEATDSIGRVNKQSRILALQDGEVKEFKPYPDVRNVENLEQLRGNNS